MQDHRRVARTKIRKHARIAVADASRAIECVVSDLTNLGAGLCVSPTAAVPDRFELIFDSFLSRRDCRVRWRDGGRLGVEFVIENAA